MGTDAGAGTVMGAGTGAGEGVIAAIATAIGVEVEVEVEIELEIDGAGDGDTSCRAGDDDTGSIGVVCISNGVESARRSGGLGGGWSIITIGVGVDTDPVAANAVGTTISWI